MTIRRRIMIIAISFVLCFSSSTISAMAFGPDVCVACGSSNLYKGPAQDVNHTSVSSTQHSYKKTATIFCNDCEEAFWFVSIDMFYENHTFEGNSIGQWTGNHYHESGNSTIHHFEYFVNCDLCGYESSSVTTWVSKLCMGDSNGNGCILPYNIPVEEVEY